MSWLRTFGADLALGVRLAIGDRRTPWGRLVLLAVGIGLGVAVLLLGASVPNALEGRHDRLVSREMHQISQVPSGPVSVLGSDRSTSFRGQPVRGVALKPLRQDAPLPGGVTRFPAPGELVVSPALAELLTTPDAEILRPRLPGRVVGVIGPGGLSGPQELYFYTGVAEPPTSSVFDQSVIDHFGESSGAGAGMSESTRSLLAMGACALLLPVVVFVVSTTRLAEAARQRRLAALRLVGASARQVRRIASGESLVGAVLGVAVGWGMFLVGRASVERFAVLGESFFSSDLSPVWWWAALVSAGVPLLTVLVALGVLRRAVTEPLGVVHRARPKRRKLWWRAVVLLTGSVGVAVSGEVDSGWTSDWMSVSISLVLLSVPLLLPWAIEGATARLRAGPLPWQLAIRRLHLTSGTAARSVSAIAVVVAGVIGLQTVLATAENEYAARSHADQHGVSALTATGDEPGPGADGVAAARARIAALPGVTSVVGIDRLSLQAEPDRHLSAAVADCRTITRVARVIGCRDGAVFAASAARPGEVFRPGEVWRAESVRRVTAKPAAWQVRPWHVFDRSAAADPLDTADVLLTPSAASGVPPDLRVAQLAIQVAPDAPHDLVESIRNICATELVGSTVSEQNPGSSSLQLLSSIKHGLLLGALVTFALIGCSLLVTAVEQIQERARPMAVLGAVGARRSTLTWSAFLQNAVPMLVATLLAVPTGLLLGMLVSSLSGLRWLAVDLPGMAVLLGIAAVSVLVVTALTAPTLSRAMNPEGLHAE